MSIEKFDCCSSFNKCSDAMACIHQDNPRYDNCTYRKKLEMGICFHGKNRNLKPLQTSEPAHEQSPKPITKIEKNKEEHKPKIYLACYKQLFAVLARSDIWSYQLNEETANCLSNQFDIKSIPYRTSLDVFEELPGDEIDLSGPCNSRVVFKVMDKEFHILNYNSYLIQSYYAEKINKSLIAKGFESRVELIGSYNKSNCEINSICKRSEMLVVKQATILKTEVKPIQLTLFDLTEITAPRRRRAI
jgi:hypothetical protein